MMKVSITVFLFAGLLLSSFRSVAQAPAKSGTPAALLPPVIDTAAIIKNAAAKVVRDTIKVATYKFTKSNSTPNANSNFVNSLSGISLSSQFTKDVSGKANLSINYKFNTFAIQVLQTLNSGQSAATPFDLNGLSSGTTMQFSYQHIFWNPKFNKIQIRTFDELKAHYIRNKGIKDTSVMDALTLDMIVQDSSILAEMVHDQERVSLLPKSPFFFNASYYLKRSAFTFTSDTVTLKNTSLNELTNNAKVSVGIVMPGRKFPSRLSQFLDIAYTYSQNYKTSDSVTILTPLGTSKNYVLTKEVLGAPKLSMDNQLSIEYRATIDAGDIIKNFSLGIGPSVTYGINSQKLAVQVPIYFINGTDGEGKITGLQGGVRLGYLTSTTRISSFKDGFGAELLITMPFDVFGDLGN